MKAIIATILLMLGIASMIVTPITHADAKPYKSVSEVKLLKKINTSPESKTLQCKKGLVSMTNNKKRQICVYESSVEKYTAIGWQLAEGAKPVTVPNKSDSRHYYFKQRCNATISTRMGLYHYKPRWSAICTKRSAKDDVSCFGSRKFCALELGSKGFKQYSGA
ncbi:MAG: hypothetical protein EB158_04115 [Nitrosopumilaceae archaeon]|nr:hypothetical protein [Nitrosopumilaceae archaeon]